MTMAIREDVLRHAALLTLERYPLLAESGKYKVGYLHKTICVEAEDTLCDTKGLTVFMNALLCRYVEVLNYPISKGEQLFKDISSVPHEADSEDAFVLLDDIPSNKPVWYMQAHAFHAPVGEGDQDCVTQIRIPLEDKHGKPKMVINTDLIHYLAPLMSEAVRSKYDQVIPAGEYVVGKFQIDLRPFFHSATLRPYKTPVYLAYNRSLGSYPSDTVFLSQKKLLDAQLKKDTLAWSAQCKIKGNDEDDLATYNVESGGIIHLPESLARYVTDYFCVSSPNSLGFNLSLLKYNNVLTISITHKQSDSDICWSLMNLLRQYDFPAYISDEYICRPMEDAYKMI